MGLCLLVGMTAAAVTTANLRSWYLSLTPPAGMPPSWLATPVWCAVSVLVGAAAWLVWRRVGSHRALRLWGWQLLVNAAWSPAFFGMHSPVIGLVVMAALLALTAATVVAFQRIRPLAAGMLLPYLVGICYVGYLNLGFWWLNRG